MFRNYFFQKTADHNDCIQYYNSLSENDKKHFIGVMDYIHNCIVCQKSFYKCIKTKKGYYTKNRIYNVIDYKRIGNKSHIYGYIENNKNITVYVSEWDIYNYFDYTTVYYGLIQFKDFYDGRKKWFMNDNYMCDCINSCFIDYYDCLECEKMIRQKYGDRIQSYTVHKTKIGI